MPFAFGFRERLSDWFGGLGRYRTPLTVVLLSAVYFGAGKAGLLFASIQPNATGLWPPTAISLAALIILGRRVWPGIFLGAFLVNMTTAGSFWTSLAIAAGNTLEAVLGAYLIVRFAGGGKVLHNATNIVRFVFAAGISALVSATFGVSSLSAAGFSHWNKFSQVWLTWWMGDVISDLVLAPMILVFYYRPRREITLDYLVNTVILFACLFLAGQLAFSGILPISDYPLEFICIPVLIWAAFQFNQLETAAAAAFLASIVIWHTLHGSGPFARHSANQNLFLANGYVAVTSIMTWIMEALVRQQKQAEMEIWQAHSDLEKQVEQRTLDLSKAVDIAVAEIGERKQRQAELNLIHTLSSAIQETETLEAALAITIQKVCETTNWVMGQGWIKAPNGKELYCIANWTRGGTLELEKFVRISESSVLRMGEGIPGMVWASKRQFWFQDVQKDQTLNFPRIAHAREAGLKAALGVPILVRNEVIAVLEFFVLKTLPEDSRMIELISTVAAQLGSVIERKKIEEELRKQSQIMQSILDNMAEGIILVSNDGKMQLSNSAARRLLQPNEPFAPLSYWIGRMKAFWSDGKTRLPEEQYPIMRALRGESVDDFEISAQDPAAGSEMYFSITARPIKDSSGEIRAAVSVFRDITERRRVERKLTETEQRFRLLVEGVADYAIYMTDPEGFIVSWNDGAKRITGFDTGEIIGQHFSKFYLPEDAAAGKPERLIEQARALGRVEDEGFRVRKDGSRFISDSVMSAIRDGSGKLLGFSKVTRDITERKRNEETIRLYADIVWNAQIGLAVLRMEKNDPNKLRILAVNPAIDKAIGLPLRNCIGQYLSECAPELYRTEYPKILANVITGGQSADLQEIIYSGAINGIFSAKCFPLPNQCVGVALENITDRKRKEDALKRLDQLKAEIDQRRDMDALKDQFISTVSHELRTPLTIVEGTVDNLRDGLAGPLARKQKELISMAHRNIHRLARMINNLLDLSRLESGKAKMNRTTFDLKPLAADIVQGFKNQAVKERLSIKFMFPKELPPLSGDPEMIGQVLTNLLDNALRFAKTEVTVKCRTQPGEVQVTVADDGNGIPEDKIGNLFNKFIQVNRVSGNGYKGTGLGLAICKEIISVHKGKIWVESQLNRGTLFHFTLPLSIKAKVTRAAI